jgi:endoglucanase
MKPSIRTWLGRTALAVGVLVGISAGYQPEAFAATPATGELIVNGTFDSGTEAPWWNGNGTQTWVENGQWRVDVAGGTANPWDAMVGQNDIRLASGTSYTLSFDASAAQHVTIVTTVQLGASPYTNTLHRSVALSTERKHYIFPFTSTIGTTIGQVTFQFGGTVAGYTARLDNISLTPSPLALTSGFYVDPDSNPKTWVAANPGDGRAAAINSEIAAKPGASWFGNWCKWFSGQQVCGVADQVSRYVGAADTADRLPMLVAYNIPGRDCGGSSSGGAGSPDAYRTWISTFARAIGNRPAVVIIEPDALAQLDCLPNDTERQIRIDLLRYASEQFRDHAPNTWAYLDGGNATWIAADTMAQRLEAAGLREIRGFAVNVSNFHTTTDSINYANAVNASLSSRYGYTRTFVVDTSRNGNGSNGEWCNPAGRRLGAPTQAGGGAELLLWVKVPGDSDGPCGTSTYPAGQFDPRLADNLIYGY